MPDEAHRYVWFGPETVQQLRAQLNAASDAAILKVAGQGEHMTLEVVEQDAAGVDRVVAGPLNEAHPCPPFCR